MVLVMRRFEPTVFAAMWKRTEGIAYEAKSNWPNRVLRQMIKPVTRSMLTAYPQPNAR